jgi:hypothetical protein
MGIVLDDDFQSYALGQNPPYGPIVKIGVTNAAIAAGGIFGDTQSVALPAFQCLQWPGAAHSPLDHYYQQSTIIFGFQVTAADTSQNGELIQLHANQNGGFDNAVLTLKVMNDGTLAFTTENQLNIFAISDFSLLTNQWYWFQLNVAFAAIAGALVYTAQVAINGQVVLSVTNLNTGLLSALYPTPGFNYWVLSGCGLGNALARITMYDAIQPVGTAPHPGGTPAARINQGLIELILKAEPTGPGTGPTVSCPLGGGTATVGVFYSKTIPVSGGISPITLAITAGSLPPGLVLDPVARTISGFPTTPGTYNYTCTGTDASTNTGTPATCQIVVGSSLAIAIVFCGVIRYLVKDTDAKKRVN